MGSYGTLKGFRPLNRKCLFAAKDNLYCYRITYTAFIIYAYNMGGKYTYMYGNRREISMFDRKCSWHLKIVIETYKGQWH